jgi:hypothetical protein
MKSRSPDGIRGNSIPHPGFCFAASRLLRFLSSHACSDEVTDRFESCPLLLCLRPVGTHGEDVHVNQAFSNHYVGELLHPRKPPCGILVANAVLFTVTAFNFCTDAKGFSFSEHARRKKDNRSLDFLRLTVLAFPTTDGESAFRRKGHGLFLGEWRRQFHVRHVQVERTFLVHSLLDLPETAGPGTSSK